MIELDRRQSDSDLFGAFGFSCDVDESGRLVGVGKRGRIYAAQYTPPAPDDCFIGVLVKRTPSLEKRLRATRAIPMRETEEEYKVKFSREQFVKVAHVLNPRKRPRSALVRNEGMK